MYVYISRFFKFDILKAHAQIKHSVSVFFFFRKPYIGLHDLIGKKKIKRKYTPTQSANHRIISLDIPISKITHSGNKKK